MKTKDRMGLITTILAVTLFVTAVFVPVRVAAQTTDAVLSFEGGNLYKADKIYIAQLSGTLTGNLNVRLLWRNAVNE